MSKLIRHYGKAYEHHNEIDISSYLWLILKSVITNVGKAEEKLDSSYTASKNAKLFPF